VSVVIGILFKNALLLLMIKSRRMVIVGTPTKSMSRGGIEKSSKYPLNVRIETRKIQKQNRMRMTVGVKFRLPDETKFTA